MLPPATATSLVPMAMALSNLPGSKKELAITVASLPAPRANAELKRPSEVLASLLAPTATARPPKPEVACAVPNWTNVRPKTETATFKGPHWRPRCSHRAPHPR